MKEKDIIKAGFKKHEANHLETGNSYDYYYYVLDLCEGIYLVSSESDNVTNPDDWYITLFDIPAIKIKNVSDLKDFIKIVNRLYHLIK